MAFLQLRCMRLLWPCSWHVELCASWCAFGATYCKRYGCDFRNMTCLCVTCSCYMYNFTYQSFQLEPTSGCVSWMRKQRVNSSSAKPCPGCHNYVELHQPDGHSALGTEPQRAVPTRTYSRMEQVHGRPPAPAPHLCLLC